VSQPCIGAEEQERVAQVMRSGWLTQGKVVAEFERALGDYLGGPHVVTCSSGTTALHLALAALGIEPGDEVLVPDLTFVATANAVRYVGATPILVDVDPETWNIDLEEAAAHLSPRTRAILPVHLYGVPCNMASVRTFAQCCDLLVVEDAAEGFTGSWDGQPCGAMGKAGTLSFFGNKIVTCGEGGAVVTFDKALAERLRYLRGQAQSPSRRYYHLEVGYNYRMTEMQAAVGLGQLAHLGEMLASRHSVCSMYSARTSHLGYSSMQTSGAGYAPWLFTLQLASQELRAEVVKRLGAAGIDTRPVFVPLHELPMYKQDEARFPIAAGIGRTGLSLPTYADLPQDAVEEICDIMEVLCTA
jgi:perosamine synthetase